MNIELSRNIVEEFDNYNFSSNEEIRIYNFEQPNQKIKFKKTLTFYEKNSEKFILKEIWYMENANLSRDSSSISINGECCIYNFFKNDNSKVSSHLTNKNIIISKNNNLLFEIKIMNDCLVCDKETIMYNNYQICHHCFKKIFHINKSNKQYINDLPNYLIKISKTGLWKTNGLPNNTSLPTFSKFLKDT